MHAQPVLVTRDSSALWPSPQYQRPSLPENGDRLQGQLVGLGSVSNSVLDDLCFRTAQSWLLTVRKIYPITTIVSYHCCLKRIPPLHIHGWLHRGQHLCHAQLDRAVSKGRGARLTDLSSVGHCTGAEHTHGSALNCTSGAGGRADDIPRSFFSCMMVELARMR